MSGWHEGPYLRPTFSEIVARLKRFKTLPDFTGAQESVPRVVVTAEMSTELEHEHRAYTEHVDVGNGDEGADHHGMSPGTSPRSQFERPDRT